MVRFMTMCWMIGPACACRLAATHLVVLANRDVGKSEGVAREFANDGLRAVAIACDVTNPESVAEMVSRAPNSDQ